MNWAVEFKIFTSVFPSIFMSLPFYRLFFFYYCVVVARLATTYHEYLMSCGARYNWTLKIITVHYTQRERDRDRHTHTLNIFISDHVNWSTKSLIDFHSIPDGTFFFFVQLFLFLNIHIQCSVQVPFFSQSNLFTLTIITSKKTFSYVWIIRLNASMVCDMEPFFWWTD